MYWRDSGKVFGSKYVVECSGRHVYANGGILGIDKDGVEVSEGYDGHLGEYDKPFTQEEKQEIADYAIEMWKRWRDRKLDRLGVLT